LKPLSQLFGGFLFFNVSNLIKRASLFDARQMRLNSNQSALPVIILTG
jgi:hypothetical protein